MERIHGNTYSDLFPQNLQHQHPSLQSQCEKRCDEEEKEKEEVGEYFEEASKSDGISEPKGAFPLPSWVDVEKIRAGQQFVRDHFFSVFFAHFISLIFLLAYTPVRVVLLRTGKSDTKLKSLKRYLSTLVHIKKWYEESDICEPGGKASEDILQIRQVHSKVAKHIKKVPQSSRDTTTTTSSITSATTNNNSDIQLHCNSDDQLCNAVKHAFTRFVVKQGNSVTSEEDITNNNNNNNNDYDSEAFQNTIFNHENNNNINSPSVKEISEQGEQNFGISQLDMMVTQFCFMGFIQLYPESFGVHPQKKNPENGGCSVNAGLEGFIHLWALIGHLLGIEDRFNLCLPQNLHKTPLVLNHILIPELGKCDKSTVTLWNSLTSGISSFIPFISLRAVLEFVVRNVLPIVGKPNAKTNEHEGFDFDLFHSCDDSSQRSNSTDTKPSDTKVTKLKVNDREKTNNCGADEKNECSEIAKLFLFYDSTCYFLMSKCFSSWLKYLFPRRFFNSLLRLAIHTTSLRILSQKQEKNKQLSSLSSQSTVLPVFSNSSSIGSTLTTLSNPNNSDPISV